MRFLLKVRDPRIAYDCVAYNIRGTNHVPDKEANKITLTRYRKLVLQAIIRWRIHKITKWSNKRYTKQNMMKNQTPPEFLIRQGILLGGSLYICLVRILRSFWIYWPGFVVWIECWVRYWFDMCCTMEVGNFIL